MFFVERYLTILRDKNMTSTFLLWSLSQLENPPLATSDDDEYAGSEENKRI
jgi:hypothetical protein